MPASTAVLGTGSCLPDRIVSNADIAATAGVDDAWIRRKTGITERRWIRPGQATSDLAITAAGNAIAAAGIRARDLSTIIVATSTPDHPLPPTACYVQRGLSDCHATAFDVNAVCSGFVFALAVGRALRRCDGGYVLVIGADTYSTILNPADRSTVPLFGDAAGAIVLGPARPGSPVLLDIELTTDGSRADLIEVPAGGSRMPCTPDRLVQHLHSFTMQGRHVREFVAEHLPQHIKQFLHSTGTVPDDIAHFIPHQANKAMLDDILPTLGLPYALVHDTATRYGNTAAASIPLTLDQAARSGKITPKDLILLTGFGGGMSLGSALIRW